MKKWAILSAVVAMAVLATACGTVVVVKGGEKTINVPGSITLTNNSGKTFTISAKAEGGNIILDTGNVGSCNGNSCKIFSDQITVTKYPTENKIVVMWSTDWHE